MLMRMWIKQKSYYCWWESTLVQLLCKTVQRFFITLKMKLSYNLERPLAFPKRKWNQYIKEMPALLFSLSCNQEMETTQLHQGVKKMAYIFIQTRVGACIHTYTYKHMWVHVCVWDTIQSFKKGNSFVTWKNLEATFAFYGHRNWSGGKSDAQGSN